MLSLERRARSPRVVFAASMITLALFAGCAEEESPPDGGGGSGAGIAEGGGTPASSSASMAGPTTSSSSTMTTSSSSTASSGGGGMGGGGGGGGGGGNPDYPFETEPNDTQGFANALPDGALGFTATIDDSNDFDVFVVDVPLGSTMRAAISDGMGGCPPDADVMLQIFGPLDTEIASASGLCPELSGVNTPALGTVNPGGLHFVRVTADAAVASYIVEIEVNPPVCGDNIVQLGEECDDGNAVDGDGCETSCHETPVCGDSDVQITEQCDDGNTNAGDGCNASCDIEGNWCYEAEPNGTLSTATPIAGCDGGAGMIDPVGDKDWFEVQVGVAGASIRAEVLGINGTGCPSGFDSMLRLYDDNGTEIGTDNNDGNSDCSLINPITDAFATSLPIGTYYLSVEEDGNDAVGAPYVLSVDVLAPGCGDGIIQVGEECDDANTNDGDGCDSTCQLEGNYCPESEPNNTIAAADVLSGCTGAVGSVTPLADHDVYAVPITVPGSSIRIEVVDINGAGCPVSFDSLVTLFSPTSVSLGTDDDDGNDLCSLVNPVTDLWARNLPAGTHYVQVNELSDDETSPPYLVKIDVLPPACGDSIVQSGEECDDGNTSSGDGCDSTCQLEGNFCTESEPNDSFGIATSLASCVGGTGAINYIGDPDYFSFVVSTPGSSVRLEVVDTSGTGCPAGFDSFVRLYNSSMMQLGTDNDDGNASCSLIQPSTDVFAQNLPVGTYFVRVEENGNDATSAPYIVLATVSAPGCGDGIVQVGEQCDDNNTVDGDGCSSTCQLLECGAGQTAVTLSSTDLPQNIDDNDTATPALSTITVTDVGTVASAALKLNIDHNFMGDVEVSLDPPGAPELFLVDNIGGSNDDMINTVFTSAAAPAVTSGSPPWTGIWSPQGNLAGVVGTPANGAWTVKALDNAGGVAGVFQSYTLYLCVQP